MSKGDTYDYAAGTATTSTPDKCEHCKWPLVTHRGPGCPCMECGQYGHRTVDCVKFLAAVK